MKVCVGSCAAADFDARIEVLEKEIRKLLWSQAQYGHLPIDIRVHARAVLKGLNSGEGTP